MPQKYDSFRHTKSENKNYKRRMKNAGFCITKKTEEEGC